MELEVWKRPPKDLDAAAHRGLDRAVSFDSGPDPRSSHTRISLAGSLPSAAYVRQLALNAAHTPAPPVPVPGTLAFSLPAADLGRYDELLACAR